MDFDDLPLIRDLMSPMTPSSYKLPTITTPAGKFSVYKIV